MKLTRKLFGRGGSGKLPDETEAILDRHLDGDFRIFPMAETKTSAAQSFRSQPTSRCRLRTTRRPIVTSSSSEMGRDSMPV